MATEKAELAHDLRDPVRGVDIVLEMSKILISVGKLADDGHVMLFYEGMVKVYDGKFVVSNKAVILDGKIQVPDCIVFH